MLHPKILEAWKQMQVMRDLFRQDADVFFQRTLAVGECEGKRSYERSLVKIK